MVRGLMGRVFHHEATKIAKRRNGARGASTPLRTGASALPTTGDSWKTGALHVGTANEIRGYKQTAQRELRPPGVRLQTPDNSLAAAGEIGL
jgi:hypothetical protein